MINRLVLGWITAAHTDNYELFMDTGMTVTIILLQHSHSEPTVTVHAFGWRKGGASWFTAMTLALNEH